MKYICDNETGNYSILPICICDDDRRMLSSNDSICVTEEQLTDRKWTVEIELNTNKSTPTNISWISEVFTAFVEINMTAAVEYDHNGSVRVILHFNDESSARLFAGVVHCRCLGDEC